MATEIISACSDPAFFDYVSILEKTNEQLSFSYTFIGVGVGMLSILFSVVAIVFAFFLFKQSQEYKSSFKTFLDKQEAIAREQVDNHMKQLKAETQEEIEEAKSALASTSNATDEERKKIELLLATLEKQKERLESFNSKSNSASILATSFGSNFGNIMPGSVETASVYSQKYLNPYTNAYSVDGYVVAPGSIASSDTKLEVRVKELEAKIKELQVKHREE